MIMQKALQLCLFCILGVASLVHAQGEPIRVVTSFSILENLVTELGGEQVSVTNLVGRNSDAHTYRPKPSDAIAISKADLVVSNGMGFEGWMMRLIENSGYQKKQLIASAGVTPLRYENETDPHAWQSFSNIRMYVKNITEALSALKPKHSEYFSARKGEYLKSVATLEREIKNKMQGIPLRDRIVVTGHDAFGYLGRDYNIKFLAPLGLSVETEASAEQVASVIDQIRQQNVNALFLENISNPRLLERISAETGVGVGGRLYSDALSEHSGPANSYLNMMRHNLESLVMVMGSTLALNR